MSKTFLSESKITSCPFCNILSKFRGLLRLLFFGNLGGEVLSNSYMQLSLQVKLDNLPRPLFVNLEPSGHLLNGFEQVLLQIGLDLG
jgi:hypothetical protein